MTNFNKEYVKDLRNLLQDAQKFIDAQIVNEPNELTKRLAKTVCLVSVGVLVERVRQL